MQRRTLISTALALAFAAPIASAETFPSRTIRIVVNTAPGASTDAVARLMAKLMSEKLGQSVIVENRAGADGLVGIRAVQSAKPDGYTILVATGTYVVQPIMKKDAGYEALKDFKPIGLAGRAPLLVMVGGEQPDKDFGGYVARAKANPGALTYASAGVGTLTHLPMALLNQLLKVDMQHVPYKGNGVAFADVAGNRVNSMMTTYSSALSYMQSGKMRPLAVTSQTRLASLPNVPTLAELGVPNYNFYTWYGLMAPAGTPDAVIKTLSDALRAAQDEKEVAERFRLDGTEVTRLSPQEFTQFIQQETSKLEKLVADLGLTKE